MTDSLQWKSYYHHVKINPIWVHENNINPDTIPVGMWESVEDYKAAKALFAERNSKAEALGERK